MTNNEEIYERLKAKLSIDKLSMDKELEEMPELVQEVGEIVSDLTCKLDEVIAERKVVWSGYVNSLSTEAVNPATKKPYSISAAEKQADIEPDVLECYDRERQCRKELDRFISIREGLKAKGYSLNTLADLWIGTYWTGDSVSTGVK